MAEIGTKRTAGDPTASRRPARNGQRRAFLAVDDPARPGRIMTLDITIAHRLSSGTSQMRRIAYLAFFLIGIAELRFQWHVAFDADRSGLAAVQFETMLVVVPLAVAACWIAFSVADGTLRTLATSTIVVCVGQVVGAALMATQEAVDLWNGVCRAWGLLCLLGAPIGGLATTWRFSALVLAALLLVTVPLSLAWKWDRQALVWREPAPPTAADEFLFRAAAEGDLTGVQRLLAAGARLDATDKGGWDALMHAVAGGDPAVVRYLLQRGADPNVRERMAGVRPCIPPPPRFPDCGGSVVSGRTALMSAALGGEREIVRELLLAGADPKKKDADGKTASQLARDQNFAEIAAVLEHAEASTR